LHLVLLPELAPGRTNCKPVHHAGIIVIYEVIDWQLPAGVHFRSMGAPAMPVGRPLAG
jgi:hypothetical protein